MKKTIKTASRKKLEKISKNTGKSLVWAHAQVTNWMNAYGQSFEESLDCILDLSKETLYRKDA